MAELQADNSFIDYILYGSDVVGRKISINWVDGKAYDAVILDYNNDTGEMKMFYQKDEVGEILCKEELDETLWVLYPKKLKVKGEPYPVGTVVKCRYDDGNMYEATVYKTMGGKKGKMKAALHDEDAEEEDQKWKSFDLRKNDKYPVARKSPNVEEKIEAPACLERVRKALKRK